jgi:hypothetical protein
MGYRFWGCFAKCPDEKSAKEIIRSASEKWPDAKSKIIKEPFFGIGVSMPDFRDAQDDETYEKTFAIEEQLPEFSKNFPEQNFVYVEADCFGGTCLYEGYICKKGEVIFKAKSEKDSLIKLMKEIKVKLDKKGHFKPFERGFFG